MAAEPFSMPATPLFRNDVQPPSAQYRRWLLAILLVATGLRLVMLVDQRLHNPFFDRPINDEFVYWDWAGHIAAGEWIGHTPFLSAPLYPYFLGIVRLAGGGFTTVFLFQITMQIAAAWFIADAARRRFGERVGLAAACVFLLLSEPAAYEFRILNNSLQLLLVAWLWREWVRVESNVTTTRAIRLGALIGLNCLASPPMLLVLAAIGPWIILTTTHRRTAIGRAAAALLSAAIVVAPATLHNYYVTREFIPIRHAGIAALFGNQVGGDGTFRAIPGISDNRTLMYLDAARLYERETGLPMTWNGMDRHFAAQAARIWRDAPFEAIKLFGRKLRWFFTGLVYDDIISPYYEIRAGFARSTLLAPLPASFILLPAILGAIFLFKKPVRFAPEWLLIVAPLLAVLAFQYTPRYRMPALPIASALAVCALFPGRVAPSWRIPAWPGRAALVFAPLFVPWNVWTRFDAPARWYAHFLNATAIVSEQAGRFDEAATNMELAVADQPATWQLHEHLGRIYCKCGRPDDARREFDAAVQRVTDDASALADLGDRFAELHSYDRAAQLLKRAHGLALNDRDITHRFCSALLAVGRYREARDVMTAAARIGSPDDWLDRTLAWLLATCPDAAVRDGPTSLQIARRLIDRAGTTPARLDLLAAAQAECGRFDDAIATTERAIEMARTASRKVFAAQIEQRLELYRSHRPYHAAPATGRGPHVNE